MLSDYVPFYLTPLSMMAYNIHTGRNVRQRRSGEIVILVSSVHKLCSEKASFIMTDRHASVAGARFFNDEKGLACIDWQILQARDFSRDNEDLGKTDRYQAEVLVHNEVPLPMLLGIACYDQTLKTEIQEMTQKVGVKVAVITKTGWYF